MPQQPLYGLVGNPLTRSETSGRPGQREPGKRLDILLPMIFGERPVDAGDTGRPLLLA